MTVGDPCAGEVAPELAVELPGLCLLRIDAPGGRGPSSRALRGRLGVLADRGRGADAVALRTRPVPRAYRAFLRQVGLDPDVQRIPAEAVMVQRLAQGGLVTGERIADACRLAVVETGVGVWALDGAAVAEEGPGIRVASVEEPGAGGLVVADPDAVHARLFEEPLPGSAPRSRTRELVLFAVGVGGVPEIHLHEALWLARGALES